MTLQEFKRDLKSQDTEVRAYLAAKLMRQAKPDDVFTFLTLEEIVELWPNVKGYLGKEALFWEWLLGILEKQGRVKR